MRQCKTCGSYAVNPSNHGRDLGVDMDLCDVCYWRTRAKQMRMALEKIQGMDSATADPAKIGLAALGISRTALKLHAGGLWDG